MCYEVTVMLFKARQLLVHLLSVSLNIFLNIDEYFISVVFLNAQSLCVGKHSLRNIVREQFWLNNLTRVSWGNYSLLTSMIGR